MGEVKHTPGGWFSAPTGEQMRAASMSYAVATADMTQVVAGCFEDVAGGDAEAAANARLIAASPDLLEALCEIEDVLSNMGRDADHDGLAEVARAAIAKATGSDQ
jgi:hypothetical protein